ncbi:hypothetical protein EDC96DRAFT_544271 [Choanephora cucurbitarum]|nr:hypothetical protein EDC96DRAFT_544271 [Choanephora cucurbitarum]
MITNKSSLPEISRMETVLGRLGIVFRIICSQKRPHPSLHPDTGDKGGLGDGEGDGEGRGGGRGLFGLGLRKKIGWYGKYWLIGIAAIFYCNMMLLGDRGLLCFGYEVINLD